MTKYEQFRGNCPANVAKDAKYTVRQQNGRAVVGLVYRAADGERWHASTESHARLVDLVNDVKVAHSGRPFGPFYINEYRQVIVPVGQDGTYYLAGEYHQHVQFEFEGTVLCGDARTLTGERIQPGDVWVGPHPGIPYVLKASGDDVYYRSTPRPNVIKDVLLSRSIGREHAAQFGARVRTVKGFQGGRFYINEWRQMFAPISRRDGLEYVYIGELKSGEPWFTNPHAENSASV